jgi:hypothetical protein
VAISLLGMQSDSGRIAFLVMAMHDWALPMLIGGIAVITRMTTWVLLALAIGSTSPSLGAEPATSHDDPQLGRVEGYSISEYSQKRFDGFDLRLSNRSMHVEGHVIFIWYRPNGSEDTASCLEIHRSFLTVLSKQGEVLSDSEPIVGRFTRNGGNVFVQVICHNNGDSYDLSIVEERPFRQLISPDQPAQKP